MFLAANAAGAAVLAPAVWASCSSYADAASPFAATAAAAAIKLEEDESIGREKEIWRGY